MAVTPAPRRSANVLWALFGFDGRIGRESFWLGFLLMTAVASIAMTPYRLQGGLPEEPDLYFAVLVGIALWSEVALTVKRLHDRGLSGFFALLLAVPVVNLGTFIVIGLIPGDAGANRFGPGTDQRNT